MEQQGTGQQAGADSCDGTLSFETIFEKELEVVAFRRAEIKKGELAKERRLSDPDATKTARRRPSQFLVRRDAPAVAEADAGDNRARNQRTDQAGAAAAWDTVRLKANSNLTGMALSGGGIRSAAFCLGVLQALDSLTDDPQPNVLDAVDYISAVSGGGYIGTSLVAAMTDNPAFPFASRLDEQETPDTQHLRDYSNFLVPGGLIDYLVSFALVLRGLLVNAILVFPVLLLLAALTLLVLPFVTALPWPFTLTLGATALLALLMIASALFRPVLMSSGIELRHWIGVILGASIIVVVGIALFEEQPFILKEMVCAAKSHVAVVGDRQPAPSAISGVGCPSQPPTASSPADDKKANGASDTGAELLSWFAKVFPTLAAVIAPLAAMLIAAGQKLANLAKASTGEETWTAIVKKYSSKLALYLAAFIVPLFLWIAYIYLCFWAIEATVPNSEASSFIVPGPTQYTIVALALIAVCLCLGPNSNSLHALYRDRLSKAFLFTNSSAGAPIEKRSFSWLKRRNPLTGDWLPQAAYAPYLLVNTAINLEASKQLNKRGRNADVFIFSPLHIGSRATGYVLSADIEKTAGHVTLASAMATSGAAASANMGDMTVKILTFSLSLLNIRLGYWLANPKRLLALKSGINQFWSNVGAWYFAIETFGLLDENKLNVYLTDGGHIENLGIYALLQRRCKAIIAVDAEADPGMTFPSLAHLELIARIDLGVRIDLPWQSLQTSALGVTDKALYGKNGPPGAKGPHAAIGIIRYSEKESGVLIYIKSSLSGDENDYVLDYKRRNDSFPHETTLDQFFNEEQFEVYRALGFHAARGLFTGDDDFAKPAVPTAEFAGEIKKALALFNVPHTMADAVVARLEPRPDLASAGASIE